jgi:predicted ATPase
MEGKRFIRTMRLRNFLSYGSEGEEIELQPFNVLIGPNASGKSNLIEAIGLLKATPTDLTAPIRKGGGIGEWLWKGGKEPPIAEIEATLEYPPGVIPLLYRLYFTASGQRLEIVDEEIENNNISDQEQDDVYFYYRYQRDRGFGSIGRMLTKPGENLIPNRSILSQIKEPYLHPELTYLGNQFSSICLYRDWHISRNSELRKPQQTDLPEHPLLEDGSNLGLFLNNLQYQMGSRKIIKKLKKFYEEAEELSVKIYGGTVQIFIREEGLSQPIPATRLSDGTLRYLFLLALLLDPTPPPLICIEEPEIGLHPDILPTIAEMLIEASQRTQLIVTTHSDTLVSALSPKSVVVCERDDRGSHLRRLDSENLKEWLKEFSLGHLWRMGEIGGTRW